MKLRRRRDKYTDCADIKIHANVIYALIERAYRATDALKTTRRSKIRARLCTRVGIAVGASRDYPLCRGIDPLIDHPEIYRDGRDSLCSLRHFQAEA